eukprot:1195262-Prorocentrum_minimum.AAC.1
MLVTPAFWTFVPLVRAWRLHLTDASPLSPLRSSLEGYSIVPPVFGGFDVRTVLSGAGKTRTLKRSSSSAAVSVVCMRGRPTTWSPPAPPSPSKATACKPASRLISAPSVPPFLPHLLPAIGSRFEYMPPPLARLAPASSICRLLMRDWLPLRVYAAFSRAIGSRFEYMPPPLAQLAWRVVRERYAEG